jgi:hypothetical protein
VCGIGAEKSKIGGDRCACVCVVIRVCAIVESILSQRSVRDAFVLYGFQEKCIYVTSRRDDAHESTSDFYCAFTPTAHKQISISRLGVRQIIISACDREI